MNSAHFLNSAGTQRLKVEPIPETEKIDFKNSLNQQQLDAVQNDVQHAIIIAGAGAGKTRTLTYRVAWLLEKGFRAEEILLLTFTNKAASEMLERVNLLTGVDPYRIWGGTFHSIGNRILRSHSSHLGYTTRFGILDAEDQKQLIENVMKEMKIEVYDFKFPKVDLIVNMISYARNTCQNLEEYLKQNEERFTEAIPTLVEISEKYKLRKFKNNVMDFDDLLEQTVILLEDNLPVRQIYQEQFKHVLVDEYQDSNALQTRFVKAILGPQTSLMVVGDDAQSIYSWRGADVGHVIDFTQEWKNAVLYKIETNYRSVPEILDIANDSILHNKVKIEKELKAVRPSKNILPTLAMAEDPQIQAQYIAEQIEIHIDEGETYEDIAVLYRAHYLSLELQLELTRRNIPYRITSGLRFFEQAHVKDVVAMMKFVVNRRDELSFLRFIKLLPGIGSTTALKLWESWLFSGYADDAVMKEKFSVLMKDFPVSKKAHGAWMQLLYTLDELVDDHGMPVNAERMLESVMEGIYLDYMKTKFNNAELRQQDLLQLGAFSKKFASTEEFLAQLSLLSEVESDGEKTGKQGGVSLSTCHQAKGLEWKTVFGLWMTQGVFPSYRVLENWEEAMIEEERRLFYVLVTRAMDHLYLVSPRRNPMSRTGDFRCAISQFIEELGKDKLEKIRVS